MAESTSLQFNNYESINNAILQSEDETKQSEIKKFSEKIEIDQKDKIWEFLEVQPPKRLEL